LNQKTTRWCQTHGRNIIRVVRVLPGNVGTGRGTRTGIVAEARRTATQARFADEIEVNEHSFFFLRAFDGAAPVKHAAGELRANDIHAEGLSGDFFG